MTWHVVKDEFERRIAEAMVDDGFEPRSTWDGRKGEYHCVNRGYESWVFEVHVDLDPEGGAKVHVESTDVLRNGRLVDVETDEPVPERDFAFRAGDAAGMDHFMRELRKETARWAAKWEQNSRRTQVEIEGHLRDLIDRDPANAAEVIAGILNRHLDPDEIDALQESVIEANLGAPTP